MRGGTVNRGHAESAPDRPRHRPQPDAEGPVAVVDVGSNSIRLVVFNNLSRSPVTIFNEKVLCGLGRGVQRTGRLNPEGIPLALDNLARFVAIARGMRVTRIDMLATAAVRDSLDGPEFVAKAEERCGVPIRILGGDEEACFSALGALSGIPGAQGLVGDLGGGSLELVTIEENAIDQYVTLPLGPLRLIEASGGSLGKAREIVDKALGAIPWLDRNPIPALYPVGGSWRSLARIHMAQTNYPLSILHHYAMSRAAARDFTGLIAGLGRRSLARISGVPEARLDSLPYAAVVLERLLAKAGAASLVFSAHGLREGFLYGLLPEAAKREDPLIAACRDFADRSARGTGADDTLFRWTAPLFTSEQPEEANLREAACLLSDLGWRVHPDFRARQAFERTVQIPYVGITHRDRVYLASVVFARYGGNACADLAKGDFARIVGLIDKERHAQALVLGLALRLAHTVSGGVMRLLEQTRLEIAAGTLNLVLAGSARALDGAVVGRRLRSLARARGLKPEIRLV